MRRRVCSPPGTGRCGEVAQDGTVETYEVFTDQDICMAAGYGYGSDPKLFGEGKHGISELITPVKLTAADMLERARQASLACRSGAISVIEVEGK